VAIILVAIITAASLSYLWLTSGHGTPPMTPSTALTKTNVTDGVRFSIVSVSKTIPWGDVRIYVTEGLHVRYWEPSNRDFPRLGMNTNVVLGNMILGDRVVGCEILDNGDGYFGGGDEFTVSGSWGTYLATLFHEPTGGAMFQDAFSIR
jgi:hypothetical protein